jgi:hypothetical protein
LIVVALIAGLAVIACVVLSLDLAARFFVALDADAAAGGAVLLIPSLVLLSRVFKAPAR